MKLKKLLVLAASVCTIFSMTTIAFAEGEPDGTVENPFTFTDTEEAQTVTVGAGASVYYQYDGDQYMTINGTTLQVVDPNYDPDRGSAIYVMDPSGRGMTFDADDGVIDGVISYEVNTRLGTGFVLVNQNPRVQAIVSVDCVTAIVEELPGSSYDSAVELNSLTDVETVLTEADPSAMYGNAYFYKYTATEDGFYRFWIDDVSVEGVEGSIYVENQFNYASSSVPSEGVLYEESGKLYAIVYACAGEELSIQVSTVQNMETFAYPAADITWSADMVAGTEEDPIVVPGSEFSFKVPVGMEVVFKGSFEKKLLTLTDGYSSYEFDGEEFVVKNIYVDYNGKKYAVDEEGVLEILIDEEEEVYFKVGNEVTDVIGGFNIAITSAPAEDKNVVSKEEVAELEATVENAPEDSELVLAPVVWDDFNAIKEKVAEKITSGIYQIIDITLVDSFTGLPIQPEEGTVVTVTIKAPTALKDAKVVAIYRYDVDTSKLVLVDDEVEVKNGKITFDTDHFSSYVFADVTPTDEGGESEGEGEGEGEGTVPDEGTTPDGGEQNVKPGDSANISMLLFVVVMAAAVVMLTKKTVTE